MTTSVGQVDARSLTDDVRHRLVLAGDGGNAGSRTSAGNELFFATALLVSFLRCVCVIRMTGNFYIFTANLKTSSLTKEGAWSRYSIYSNKTQVKQNAAVLVNANIC